LERDGHEAVDSLDSGHGEQLSSVGQLL
jgi:hypothetical protein